MTASVALRSDVSAIITIVTSTVGMVASHHSVTFKPRDADAISVIPGPFSQRSIDAHCRSLSAPSYREHTSGEIARYKYNCNFR